MLVVVSLSLPKPTLAPQTVFVLFVAGVQAGQSETRATSVSVHVSELSSLADRYVLPPVPYIQQVGVGGASCECVTYLLLEKGLSSLIG